MDGSRDAYARLALFVLQTFGAAILAFLGSRWLRRLELRENRRSRQFEADMTWLEGYLSLMTLSLNVVEAIRRGHPAAEPLRAQAAQQLVHMTPEADVRLARVVGLGDAELNRLLDEFFSQCGDLGIQDLTRPLDQLARGATNDQLAAMRATLLLAKLRAGAVKSKGPPT